MSGGGSFTCYSLCAIFPSDGGELAVVSIVLRFWALIADMGSFDPGPDFFCFYNTVTEILPIYLKDA